MENATQEPYRDTPSPSRASSPSMSGRSTPAKPLPSLPNEPQISPQQPYRDDPSTEFSAPKVVAPRPQRYRTLSSHIERQVYFPPYSDAIPTVHDDDDVPLAHLYPYPTEAPPSYAAVVVQSYRDTLVSNIPSHPIVTGGSDEEMGFERSEPDDVRFSIERVIAKIIVALALLLVTLILVWQILVIKGSL